jgi:hypothetical protein
VLVVLACVLLAAHFFRSGAIALVLLCAAAPFLLLVRQRWADVLLRLGLLLGTVEWVRTLVTLARTRSAHGHPWVRLAVILGLVALVTALAAFAVRTRPAAGPRSDPAG